MTIFRTPHPFLSTLGLLLALGTPLQANAQTIGFDTRTDEFNVFVDELSAWTREHNSDLVALYANELQSNIVIAALPQRMMTWSNTHSALFEDSPKVRCRTGIREPGRDGAEIVTQMEVCIELTDSSIRIAQPFWASLNIDQKRLLVMRALFRLMGLSEPTRTEAGRAVALSFLEPEAARRQREAESNTPTFPLVRTGISGNGANTRTGVPNDYAYEGEGAPSRDRISGGGHSLVRGSIGISGGAQFSDASTGTVPFLGIDGRFHASYGGEDNQPTSGPEGTQFSNDLTALSVDARGTFETSFTNRPLYRVSIDASGGMPQIIGVWGAIEATQFQSLRERFARIGGALVTQAIRIGTKNYVFIRLGVGGNVANIDGLRWINPEDGSSPQRSGTSGGFSAHLSALLKLSSFFVEFRGTVDQNSHSIDRPSESYNPPYDSTSWRTSLSASVSIPLRALFSNDSLRVEGEYLRYDADSAGPAQFHVEEIATLRAVYEFRF